MADSLTVSITFTVLYAITIVASVAGNTLLIYIVWKKREVRSLASFMFVNMAVADLLVTLVAMPWSIAFFYTGGGEWLIGGLLGDITCRGTFYVVNITVIASILCLTFMAIDRYYACVWSLNSRSVWYRKAKFVAPLVWITSMSLMSFIPVLYHYRDGRCAYDFAMFGLDHKKSVIRAFFCYLFAVSYLFPLVVMTVLYAKVARKIWFHKAPGNLLTQNQRQESMKRKVVRMLIIIVVAFALCWLPAQCYFLYNGITGSASAGPYLVMYLVFWIGHANSAINPWLYIKLSSNINVAFIRMVSRMFSGRSSSLGQRAKTTRAAPYDQVAEACL